MLVRRRPRTDCVHKRTHREALGNHRNPFRRRDMARNPRYACHTSLQRRRVPRESLDMDPASSLGSSLSTLRTQSCVKYYLVTEE